MLASAAAERKQTSLQRHRDIVVCATSAIFARHARSRSEREQVRTALIGLAIASVVVIALIAMAGGEVRRLTGTLGTFCRSRE